MEEPAVQASAVPQAARDSVLARLLGRGRLLLFLAILVVELVIFSAGLFTPLSPQAQQSLENQTSTQFASVPSATPIGFFLLVFPHNLEIALLEMVPLLGAFIFGYSMYATGLAAQVIAVSGGVPAAFGAVIFAFPYTVVELSAYSIAVGSWAMLLLSLRSHSFGKELKVFILEIPVVAAVLLIAAAMETATRASLLLGFILWVPTGVAAALIVVASRRKRAWAAAI